MEKSCSVCKLVLPISEFHKDKGQKSGYKCKCKKCVRAVWDRYKSSDMYDGRKQRYADARKRLREDSPVRSWAKTTYYNATGRAKKYGLPIDISIKWLEANAVLECPLLEIPLVYNAEKSLRNSASLDRKDSTMGYTKDNCRVISHLANRIKSNATVDEILLLAKNLAYY